MTNISARVDQQIERMESLKTSSRIRFAYCGLLYGPNPSVQIIANAITLSESLKLSSVPVVLLITPDVPDSVRDILVSTGRFARVHVVEYIMGSYPGLFKKDWFRDVFTKLHIFNMTEFDKVIFLDLDMVVSLPEALDKLFQLPVMFGAMENSKGFKAGSMTLNHGERMLDKCKLINAGLIMVTPDTDLFNLLLTDVTCDSSDHEPGMTPEQFYLARVMGKHFHHISQRFNFEVQLHGGVPLTSHWKRISFDKVVCFHFSGGAPLKRIRDSKNEEWGCQTEKRMIADKWFNEIPISIRENANQRARLAFGSWALNFADACESIREAHSHEGPSWLINLVKFGHEEPVDSAVHFVGDVVDGKVVVQVLSKTELILVHPESLELVGKRLGAPTRPPPRLPRVSLLEE
jgi:hypothetical protein